MTEIARTTSHKPRSRIKLFALIAALMVFLSACGAKLNTNLTLNEDGSGTRVIEFTVERDESMEENIQGGFEAVDASIKKHLPEQLEYSGLTVGDDVVTGSFTLTFTSLDDYESKVKALLEAGGDLNEPYLEFEETDGRLKSGFRFSESYSSRSLLEWVANGLVEDGIIDESNKSSVFSEDTAVLTFKDQTYETLYGSSIDVNQVKDNGFDSIDVVILPNEDGTYEVGVRLSRRTEPEEELHKLDDELIASIDVDGLTEGPSTLFSSNDMAYHRPVTFTAADADEVDAKLNAVFGEDMAEFSATQERRSGHLQMEQTYAGKVNPSNLCSNYYCWADVDVLSPGNNEQYELLFDSLGYRTSTGEFEFTYAMPVNFESLDVKMDVSMSRAWTLEIDVVLDTNQYESLLDVVEEELTPGEDVGSIKTSDADGKRTYSIKIAENEENADAIAEYLDGPRAGTPVRVAEASEYDKEMLGADYSVRLNLSLQSLLSGASVKQIDAEINLGTFHKFTDDRDIFWEIDGGTATFSKTLSDDDGVYLPEFYGYGSGPSQGFLITMIVIGVLVIVAIVLLIVFRKRLSPALSQAQKTVASGYATAKEYGSEVMSSAAAKPAPGSYPGGQPGGEFGGQPGENAPGGAPDAPDGPFTEHDLR
ncbi:hypothetical protein [Trueperella bialowiezensis]|uniref:Uncharacterized protein n=1 Tax=Trueperella bialowiezensis TaxID=312285 RepID=A0A448PFE4_9ACTO|nr:hypothetical protein [Trueperella bialowiezensis]VEI13640.1 Uncharacterised protein [Trueperella bialowiezensis]